MENKESLKKIKFALEWFKTGNATEAARQIGYKAPEKAAQRLKSDPYVLEQLSIIREMFDLHNVAKDEIDEVRDRIASIEEILMTLTSIMRREAPEEQAIVLKENIVTYDPESKSKTTENKERIEIVRLKTRNQDRLRAAEDLLKYFAETKTDDGGGTQTGVIFLPQIEEVEE